MSVSWQGVKVFRSCERGLDKDGLARGIEIRGGHIYLYQNDSIKLVR